MQPRARSGQHKLAATRMLAAANTYSLGAINRWHMMNNILGRYRAVHLCDDFGMDKSFFQLTSWKYFWKCIHAINEDFSLIDTCNNAYSFVFKFNNSRAVCLKYVHVSFHYHLCKHIVLNISANLIKWLVEPSWHDVKRVLCLLLRALPSKKTLIN